MKRMSHNKEKHSHVTAGLITVLSVSLLCGVSVHASDTPTIEKVLSITADTDYGEYLAGECMTCHTDQNSSDSIPVIQGQSVEAIVSALLAYKKGDRENARMRSVAGAMGAEEIAALAAYFSEIKE